ncbi:hypothetical protein QJS66_06985 [Kocuria rhizophila]|nr:hypothetical protein QJS66_06985 [Kocuria rhizophila]
MTRPACTPDTRASARGRHRGATLPAAAGGYALIGVATRWSQPARTRCRRCCRATWALRRNRVGSLGEPDMEEVMDTRMLCSPDGHERR